MPRLTMHTEKCCVLNAKSRWSRFHKNQKKRKQNFKNANVVESPFLSASAPIFLPSAYRITNWRRKHTAWNYKFPQKNLKFII